MALLDEGVHVEQDLAEQGSAADRGAVSIVERSLRLAFAAIDHPGTGGGEQMTSLPRGLNWGVLSTTGEGPLPPASVTWAGHSVTSGSAPVGAVDTGSSHAPPVAPAAEPDLSAMPMGAELVDVLAAVEVADTDDAELVDVAARWQDVISWATAMQSRATGEIARRRGWTAEHTTAAAEISARLRIPQTDANKLMARGTGLSEHPQVMNALHEGLIDTAKADILLRSGNPLTTEERDQAITAYLPQAPDRTRRWLRDKMNHHATRLHGTTEVTKQAMARRAVFIDPADNSMAWISANLPATDATAVWDAIDTAAHTIRRTPGTTRTLAQARADAFVAITTGRIIVPPRPAGSLEPATNQTHTTTSTATATRDHSASPTVPIDTGSASDSAPDPGLPRTTVPATGCTCGGCTCDGTTIRTITVRPQIRVTVPATMLLGLDDSPGHLDGYGPIPAQTAARIATDATWQRLLTDPVTGILTDYSTTTYQPGKILRQAVTTRDQTCCFPQCDRPAQRADLDHIHPYDHHLDPTTHPADTPGQTRASNLQPLCRAHHLAKTHDGWDVTRDPDTGVTTWTAPTGHTYSRPPTTTGRCVTKHDTPGPETPAGPDTSLADDIRHLLGTQDHPPRGRTPSSRSHDPAVPGPRSEPSEPPF